MSAAENICPCPYCGAEAVVKLRGEHSAQVCCTNESCWAEGPFVFGSESNAAKAIKLAATKWNRVASYHALVRSMMTEEVPQS